METVEADHSEQAANGENGENRDPEARDDLSHDSDPGHEENSREEENSQDADMNKDELGSDASMTKAPKDGTKINSVCPSVRKGEPCWALSKGKPCHYAVHDEGAEGKQPKNCNVYVCHLPLSTNKEQLEAMFAPYGVISECRLLVDPKSKEAKGVGFVHFTKPEEAKNAIDSIDGLLLTGHDKPLECRMAKPNPKAGTLLPGMEEDWECADPACAYVNWARRTRCNKCGMAKGERRGRGGYGRERYDDYRRGGGGYDDRYGSRRPYDDYYDDYRRYAAPPRGYGRPPSPYGAGGGRGDRYGGYPPRGPPYYDPYGPPAYDPYGQSPARGTPPAGGLGLPGGRRDPYLEGPAAY